ncbi:hypothetical protein [Petrotoga sp. SL27]|uniref:hypothetical protein n=1 Tax=Petrotoga sp. SL27 TaxID=1445612 RepID=UPI000CDF2586|nr:hypothetical protein [Petrotoga sp. SL27]POZ90329.1 hypothetical protein AD60_07485 [Petrotoga sp. SL27]
MAGDFKEEKSKRTNIYRIILWIAGLTSLFVFTLVINQPWILFAITIVALLSQEWLLAFIITGIRGSGIFGVMGNVEMLWVTLCIFFIFIWGLFRFFFDTDRFLRKKVRSLHVNQKKEKV